ncbi:MAG: hypothetical protein JWO23_299 [Solirubrobacterales bacterium]|nr:hypothetical protein [Solirubrobacterales bacterium]
MNREQPAVSQIRTEAGPEAGEINGQRTAAAHARALASTGGASKGLGVAALILGAVGLLAGLGALLAARRPRTMVWPKDAWRQARGVCRVSITGSLRWL